MGTWQTVPQVEYPSGSTFQVELLCLPGVVEAADAAAALKCLVDSILWVQVPPPLLHPSALDAQQKGPERELRFGSTLGGLHGGRLGARVPPQQQRPHS